MNTLEFLNEIYKGCGNGFITITLLPQRKTLWFKTSDLSTAEKEVKTHGAKTNTFFGVGLRKKVLPNNLRGSENDILAITTLYADIDIKGEAHAQTELPSSVDESIKFLNLLPLKPSIIVNSGNGIHAYWLLDKPFKIENAKDREFIAEIFRGWSNCVNSKARDHGWKLDNVSDLARILRVPGSINHKLKNGSICRVIAGDRVRHSLSNFVPFMGIYGKNNERVHFEATSSNDAGKVINKCNFIRYCKENTGKLPEPYWHAMVTNLSLT